MEYTSGRVPNADVLEGNGSGEAHAGQLSHRRRSDMSDDRISRGIARALLAGLKYDLECYG